MKARPAVFLDRDGTLVDDPGFLREPALVRLLPGAAQAVARLNRAELLAVVVTNQAGIGRGLLTEEEYRRVAERVEALLEEGGARLDGAYHCPHAPEVAPACACRKPGVLLYHRAGERLGIDLAASWWVGDRPSDLEPARLLGGRAILVRTGQGEGHAEAAREMGVPVVADLAAAVAHLLAAFEGPDAPTGGSGPPL